MAVTKAKEQEQVETPVTHDLLTAQGSETRHQPRLSEEVRAILEAPVPASEIKSYPGKGGKEMRYTSVEFVEDRIRQVDPDFGCDVVEGPRGITVHYTILGVRRGDIFDTEEDAKFGTPLTGSIARAKRRAAKSGFGIAKELWADEEGAPQTTGGARTQQGGNNSRGRGDFREPSEGRINMLTGMGVPEAVAKLINSESHKDSAGKFMKDDAGYPISDVSETIKALKAKQGRDRGPLDRRVWEPIVVEHDKYGKAKAALNGTSTTGDNDDDDDWDAA